MVGKLDDDPVSTDRPDRRLRSRWLAPILASVILLAGLGGCGSEDPGPEPEAVQRPSPDASIPEQPPSGPVLPGLTGQAGKRLRLEVARADEKGMNPDVFAKVGDSNTEWPQNLYGLGCREIGFGSNGGLKDVVKRYSQVQFPDLVSLSDCLPVNSLTRRSAATVSGVWTEWLMTPTAELPATGIAPPTEECEPQQTPLDCEIGLIAPRWVLIMTGTNDALLGRPLGDTFRGLLEQMVNRVRELGPVPVLSTLPPMETPAHNGEAGDQRIGEANRIIRRVADRMKVPLIDLNVALSAPGMVDRGLAPDGLHLGAYGGDDQPDIMRGSAMLTIPGLKYGANRRNLIWLQVLDRLDRAAGRD